MVTVEIAATTHEPHKAKPFQLNDQQGRAQPRTVLLPFSSAADVPRQPLGEARDHGLVNRLYFAIDGDGVFDRPHGVLVPRVEVHELDDRCREGPPTYTVAEEFWFESMKQLQSALGSQERQAAAGDVVNFVNGGATILVCEFHG